MQPVQTARIEKLELLALECLVVARRGFGTTRHLYYGFVRVCSRAAFGNSLRELQTQTIPHCRNYFNALCQDSKTGRTKFVLSLM